MGSYAETFRASVADPEAFWLDVAGSIDWETPPTRALDSSHAPFYRWFPDGGSTAATTRSTATSTAGAPTSRR